jgi:hypothetical protein
LSTILGLGFNSVSSLSHRIRIFETAASRTFWRSDSSVLFKSVRGSASSIAMFVSVTLRVSAITNICSYNSPFVSNLTLSSLVSSSGSTSISVFGNFFGNGASSKLRLEGSASERSTWISDSSLAFRVASGFGRVSNVLVSASVGVGLGSFNTTIVVMGFVSSTSVTNMPSSASASITVIGVGFSSSRLSHSLRMGVTAVAASSWRSSSAVLGKVASGHGFSPNTILSVAVLTRFISLRFSWNSPLVVTAMHSAVALSGSISASVIGQSFSSSGVSNSARVGRSACSTSSWSSESSLVCKIAANLILPSRSVSISVVSLHSSDVQVTYVFPVISAVNRLNKPVTGSVSVSLFGSHFATYDISSGVRVDFSAALMSRWVSDSCIYIRLSPVHGGQVHVTASISRSRGVSQLFWNSDILTLSMLSPTNSPLTGSITISMFGSSFAEVGYSASLKMTGSSCESSIWISSSAMMCKVISGFGDPVLSLSVERRHASISSLFSFDQHSMLGLISGNGPATGRVSITVVGINFGKFESSVAAKLGPHVSLGPTAFLMSSWTSDSSVRLLTPGGAGANLSVTIDVNTRSTVAVMYSYDLPVVRELAIRSCSTLGSCLVFVKGLNFASANEIVSVSMGPSTVSSIGYTSCDSVVVYNDKLLSCLVPGGVGKLISVSVTVNSQDSVLTRTFSYLQPVVLSAASNAPVTGSISITSVGSYFGYSSHLNKRVVAFGATATSEVTWISDSCVVARPSHGSSAKRPVMLTVWWQVGSISLAFSADVPTVKNCAPAKEIQSTGASIISVIGSNYGTSMLSPTISVLASHCENSLWMSSSSVFGKMHSGSASGLAIAVSVAVQFSSTTRLLSYSVPLVNHSVASAVPSSGSVHVSVFGNDFAIGSISPILRFGDSSCLASTWIADSSVVSKVRSGAGLNLALMVTITRQKSPAYVGQSYESPKVVEILSFGAAVSGSMSITVAGNHLSFDGRSQQVSVGGTPCASSNWVSSSCIQSKILPGVGLTRIVSVSTSSQFSSHSTLLSYDKPLPLDGLSISTIPATGDFLVTLRGAKFSQQSAGPLSTNALSHAAVKAGSTVCMQSAWKSDSSTICRVAPGVGINLSAHVSIFMQTGHISKSMSYLSASISGVEVQQLPASGAVSITIHGAGFGNRHSSSMTKLGTSSAQMSSWISDSLAFCKVQRSLGASISVRASVGSSAGSMLSNLLSVTVPVISALTGTNHAKSGSLSVTVIGSSFSVHGTTIASRFHRSSSLSSEWRSDSTLKSKAPPGFEGKLRMYASVALQKSASVIWTSYDTLLALSSVALVVPSSGSSLVTLSGKLFGSASFSQKISLESSAGQFHVWVSESSIVSKASSGFGRSLSLLVSLESSSFVSNAITFTAPAPAALPFIVPLFLDLSVTLLLVRNLQALQFHSEAC